MIIACISDLHSNLDFSIQPCDLLLVAGDICPAHHNPYTSLAIQANWLNDRFFPWIKKQPIHHALLISGNHDWIWEMSPQIVPPLPKDVHYLEDSLIEIEGIKIYGTPQQPPFNSWAFNREEDRLLQYWDMIPEGIDILLSHCPPYGIMDFVKRKYEKHSISIGSQSLKNRIDKIRPKYVIFGHAHSNHGIETVDGITYINCCLLSESYTMIYKPTYFNFKGD